MDILDTLKFLIPAVVGVLGWFAGHWLNTIRDRNNKLRDMRIQFLLDAYRRLEFAANRQDQNKDDQIKFESALADIQLLGTKVQIYELNNYLERHNSGGSSINPLLELMREHLRKELNLETNIPKIKIFRFIGSPAKP